MSELDTSPSGQAVPDQHTRPDTAPGSGAPNSGDGPDTPTSPDGAAEQGGLPDDAGEGGGFPDGYLSTVSSDDLSPTGSQQDPPNPFPATDGNHGHGSGRSAGRGGGGGGGGGGEGGGTGKHARAHSGAGDTGAPDSGEQAPPPAPDDGADPPSADPSSGNPSSADLSSGETADGGATDDPSGAVDAEDPAQRTDAAGSPLSTASAEVPPAATFAGAYLAAQGGARLDFAIPVPADTAAANEMVRDMIACQAGAREIPVRSVLERPMTDAEAYDVWDKIATDVYVMPDKQFREAHFGLTKEQVTAAFADAVGRVREGLAKMPTADVDHQYHAEHDLQAGMETVGKMAGSPLASAFVLARMSRTGDPHELNKSADAGVALDGMVAGAAGMKPGSASDAGNHPGKPPASEQAIRRNGHPGEHPAPHATPARPESAKAGPEAASVKPAPAAAPPQPPADAGTTYRSAAKAAAGAQRAGLVNADRPGFHSYATADSVRTELGLKGKGFEAAHVLPQAIGRHIDGYSPGRALTTEVPKATNQAIDQGWIPRWTAAVKSGEQITAGDAYQMVADAIRAVPPDVLSPAAKGALEWRLHQELYRDLGLQPTDVLVPRRK